MELFLPYERVMRFVIERCHVWLAKRCIGLVCLRVLDGMVFWRSTEKSITYTHFKYYLYYGTKRLLCKASKANR